MLPIKRGKATLTADLRVLFSLDYMYVSISLCVCPVYTGARSRLLKGALDPLEPELQVVVNHPVWMLGTELGQHFKLLSHLSPAPAAFAYPFPLIPKKHHTAPSLTEADVQGTWAFSLSKLRIPR